MKGVRWFAAEFLVVVTGVLVALAVQAVYQHRGNLKRERHYLSQIAADMRETEGLMAQSESAARIRDRAAPLLLRAYRTGAHEDSIFKWLASSTQSLAPSPVIGTVEALINSGDLSLIRNDSLRVHIARYVTQVRGRMNVYEDFSASWREGLAELGKRVDLTEVRRRAVGLGSYAGLFADSLYSPLSSAESPRIPFATEPRAILQDPGIYAALSQMNASKWVLSQVRGQMAQLSRELRTALEAELRD